MNQFRNGKNRNYAKPSLGCLGRMDTIEMHDFIQDMGKDIVNTQKDPGERSRLWLAEDFEKVITDNMGTKAIEAIWVPELELLSFSKKAMRNMKRLRILSIGVKNRLIYDGSIVYLPNNLRWFAWENYPWESLPENFEPKRLVHLELRFNSLPHLWTRTKHLPCLRKLNLGFSKSLKLTPDFAGMPNLEYLDLRCCSSLKWVHCSLENCKKLIRLNLNFCESLESFPRVNVESLEYLGLRECFRLEKFPGILGIIKRELEIEVEDSGIREFPSSVFLHQTHITKLDLSSLKNLVTLPSSIGGLKSLVELNVSYCPKLKSLPEEIGDLENLEKLDARCTLISQPLPSILRLNKLKFLRFSGCGASLNDEVHFQFPLVAEGLRSLEILHLSCCNLIDGGLPQDIGCLSSLEVLNLQANNFEHLPRSISQLGALQSLDLRLCKSLTQLPELPSELHKLHADYQLALKSTHNLLTMKKLQLVVFFPYGEDGEAYNYSIYNLFARTLFQSLSSLQHDISVSDSLSKRVFTIVHPEEKIPSWFDYWEMDSPDRIVSVNLLENWYASDFLGFAICYSGRLIETTVKLSPLCDDGGMPWMTHSPAFDKYSEVDTESTVHCFFVPLAGLWDKSKANGKTPNDYGRIRLFFGGEIKKFGIRLLYTGELGLEDSF